MTTLPARLPLLDRLLDAEPELERDPPVQAGETVERLRNAVHRDLEALLNARHPWRSLPDALPALRGSPLQYGIPDVTAGVFNLNEERERLRAAIAEAILRFEPRLTHVEVKLIGKQDLLQPLLRLRIDAVLRIEPAPEPIMFDTMVDVTTAEVKLRPLAKM
jgi:type VI secretion system protein ImpF